MLARRDDLFVDLEMEMVGRAIVHHLNLRIGQQLVVIAVSLRNREHRRLRRREFLPPLRHGDDVDKTQSPERLDVRGADETCADDAGFDFGHGESLDDSLMAE